MPEADAAGTRAEAGGRPGRDFLLPSLGADMETGTVLEWYVGPGDRVERGDLIALVATEKADIDVEIWEAGTVVDYLVDIGHEVPVGTPLLRLADGTRVGEGDDEGEQLFPEPPPGEPGRERRPPAPAATPPPEAAGEPPAPTAPPAEALVPASPMARRMAQERGIDLEAVVGTGPGGAVLARDIEGHAAPPPETPRTGEDQAGRMRRAIADRMTRSNREIPHYYLDLDIDLGPALAWLEDRNRTRSVQERILPAALLLKATAAAAVAVPELNGYWIDDQFVPAPGADLAVAVSLRGGGLITPVIREVDRRTHDEVMADLRQIVTAARQGSLRSSWMADAGLTVTNLGDRGVDRVAGVIHPPQVALVGFGRVTDRPWVVDGRVTARPIVTASLAADHRATDGATGSRFLNQLADALQNPDGT